MLKLLWRIFKIGMVSTLIVDCIYVNGYTEGLKQKIESNEEESK